MCLSERRSQLGKAPCGLFPSRWHILERRNCGDSRKSRGCRGLGAERQGWVVLRDVGVSGLGARLSWWRACALAFEEG